MTTTLSILTKNQKKQIVKHFKEDDKNYTLFIDLRFDDECNNGHNTFAITGSLYQKTYTGELRDLLSRDLLSCGCIHDDIIKHAPELAHLIKWHGVSTDRPMHYLSNTLYHAGDLDHWGKKKGEPYNFTKKIKIDNSPNEANNFVNAMTNCKIEVVEEATSWGEGKERDFEAARNSAVWPEATDEQLSLPKEDLKKLLLERLPALMQNFKSEMEKLGFTY